ncbi:hypothetical protein [Novacetimonas hansenii]|uniref:hypothetical protein n=1 Tax=Novacetimonas hansenii TaxID=436 RepID=UPI00094FCE15|nr:hypothetical protein [Novacetimonas hansenii]
MRHLILAAALLGTLSTAQAAPSCPGDTVVWLNQTTGIYHLPGDHWFGHTKRGAYVCEKQAVENGAHISGARDAGQSVGRHTHRSGRHSSVHEDGPEDDGQPEDARPAKEVGNPF